MSAEKKMVVRVIAPTREADVEIHEARPGDRIAVAYMPPGVAPRSPNGAEVLRALQEAMGEGAIVVLPHGAKFEIVQVDEAQPGAECSLCGVLLSYAGPKPSHRVAIIPAHVRAYRADGTELHVGDVVACGEMIREEGMSPVFQSIAIETRFM